MGKKERRTKEKEVSDNRIEREKVIVKRERKECEIRRQW